MRVAQKRLNWRVWFSVRLSIHPLRRYARDPPVFFCTQFERRDTHTHIWLMRTPRARPFRDKWPDCVRCCLSELGASQEELAPSAWPQRRRRRWMGAHAPDSIENDIFFDKYKAICAGESRNVGQRNGPTPAPARKKIPDSPCSCARVRERNRANSRTANI